MKNKLREPLLLPFFLCAIMGLVQGHEGAMAFSVSYNDFTYTSDFILKGDAQAATDSNGQKVLRLTPSQNGPRHGSAFLNDPVTLGKDTSFTSSFTFQISNPIGWTDVDGVQGADGLVFVVCSTSSTSLLGGPGGWLGYAGGAGSWPIKPSVGVEFDTWTRNNVSDHPPNDGNHIGIDTDGSVTSKATATVTTPFNNGLVWNALVEYSGTSNLLDVWAWDSKHTKPTDPVLSYAIDVPAILGNNPAYFGFTSGNWAASNDHDILSWDLSTSEPVPEPGTIVLLGSGLIGLFGIIRRSGRA